MRRGRGFGGRVLGRVGLMAVSVLVGLGVLAPPAGAHTISGAGATNFRTELTAVEPAAAGVTVEVIEAGSRLQLRNDGAAEVVVLGYQGEPYLRVGPEGVFENRRSPATYLNADRQGEAKAIPAEADPTAPPDWRKVASAPVARWHDHRSHWMGDATPPGVARDPDERQVVADWSVPMRQGEVAFAANGTIEWVPGPSTWPWLVLAAGLGVAAAAVVWRAKRSMWPVLAALVSVLVVVDVAHTVGIAHTLAGPLSSKASNAVEDNLLSMFAWVAGIVAVVLLARRNPMGQYPAVVAGLIVALVGGLGDLTFLGRTTLPFAWSPGLARLLVAASLGLGLGVVAGVVLAAQRSLRAAEPLGSAFEMGGAGERRAPGRPEG